MEITLIELFWFGDDFIDGNRWSVSVFAGDTLLEELEFIGFLAAAHYVSDRYGDTFISFAK